MKRFLIGAAAAAIAIASPAYAGPFILDGTDADDHGSASGGTNQNGWLYIQKALENIIASSELTLDTTNGTNIAVLGATSSAANAAASAIGATGWTATYYGDAAAINTFFADTSGASIIYIPSNGLSGGISGSEEAALTANAANIDAFVGSGGGLFSMGHNYGWLGTLVPGLTVSNEFQTGISLTGAGNAAFPGLTNSDLSAGPYHYRFNNVGSIPVLAVGTASQNPIIIGSSGGSITNPDPPSGAVPEPSTWLMLLLGFFGIGASLRHSKTGVKRAKVNTVSYG